MTEKTLFIEIFQPFAQYRNPFTFYYAQSYPLPPKSTVIGMFQNAADRYYDEGFWDLKVSVHGGFESVFWNYQQLIKGYVKIDKTFRVVNQGKPLYNEGFKSQRTPVYQQELFNGHLFIFVRGNEDLIETIKSSLEKPRKVLYLGRSEDVIFLKGKPRVLEDEGLLPQKPSTVKKSLWLRYPMYIKQKHKKDNVKKRFPIKNKKFPVYSIPVKVEFKNKKGNKEKTIRNKAEINENTERIVEFETVLHTGYDYVVYLKEKIDIEKFNINEKIFKIPRDFGWL